MSDRLVSFHPISARATRRAGVLAAVVLGAATLLLLAIVSLVQASMPSSLLPSSIPPGAGLPFPDFSPPDITNPVITETSPYLHADGTTLYYSDEMGGSGDSFWLGGNGEGSSLDEVVCSAAFGEGPFTDDTPATWRCGDYTVRDSNAGTDVITATLYNTTRTYEVEVFTYIEDTLAPTSTATTSLAYSSSPPLAVGWTAGDASSGLKETCLWYKLGELGTWTDTEDCSTVDSGTFSFSPSGGTNGTYYFQTIAEDNVGNVEDGPIGSGDDSTVFDDVDPTTVITSPAVSNETSWTVSWLGSDPSPASGIATYDVQYQVDGGGWQNWHTGVSITSDTFGPTAPELVEYDHTYEFQVTAHDLAGNQGDSSVSTRVGYNLTFLPVVVRNYSPLTNGGFENGWTGWEHGGELDHTISSGDSWSNPLSGTFAARLGNPSYNCRGGVPLGSAWVEQIITVPSDGVSALRINYRIYSEDKFSEPFYDRFEILVDGTAEYADGNLTAVYNCDHDPQTDGWEFYDLDVTSYRGQNITLRLENVSAYDNYYNTWTYVDDIQFLP